MIKDRIIANLIQEYQKVHGYDPDILALMFYREGMSINEINEFLIEPDTGGYDKESLEELDDMYL